MVPTYGCDLFQRRSDSIINATLRSVSNENFVIPKPYLSLSYFGAVIWNNIPYEVKNYSSLNCFVHNVLQWMNGP